MLNNIQKLREITGAGVMECKKALELIKVEKGANSSEG